MFHNVAYSNNYDMIIAAMMIVVIFAITMTNNNNNNNNNHNMQIVPVMQPISAPVPPSPTHIIQPVDLISVRDKRVIADPLREPLRRPARHVMGNIIANPLFNYPTRGYTDTFSLQGYLKTNAPEVYTHRDTSYDILQLFGREKWPRAREYEYYVSPANRDVAMVKVPLDNVRRELYDGDKVLVPMFQKEYVVHLLKPDGLEYNPYSL